MKQKKSRPSQGYWDNAMNLWAEEDLRWSERWVESRWEKPSAPRPTLKDRLVQRFKSLIKPG
jgi:hypothetical protein